MIDYLQQYAVPLGIDIWLLLAIAKIESNSKGFIAKNKPVVLFERHIFYRQLKKQGFDVDFLTKQYPLLINPTSGGYQGRARENYRLAMAKQIHEACAIESASFGLFQIMGSHWKALGYPSAQDFEQQMSESELKQTDAFIRFISLKGNQRIIHALKNKDFRLFARLYNGPNYAKNNYDQKIEALYESIQTDH